MPGSIKSRILAALRSSSDTVSGESLSGDLGISRVSVWKHIQRLGQCGYEIDACSTGYRLLRSPDTPFPWEFPEREGRIHFFTEVESTMDVAREIAANGCPHMSTVIAERQTRGRGRLQRSWASESGGLYFTMVLRPALPPQLSPRINFAVCLALTITLGRAYGIDAAVKWPNDVLIEDKKLAGMLSEMEAEADRISHVNVGLGINVNNDPGDRYPNAVSLKTIIGRPVSRKLLLASFWEQLEGLLEDTELDDVIGRWKNRCVTLNRKVRIETGTDVFEGRAVDLDDSGSLIIELADGRKKKVYFGDCFHV